MILDEQLNICRKYGAAYSAPAPGTKLGIAVNVKSGLAPLNGLRHPPEAGTCGWYIWAGEEFSEAANFFQPLHVDHVAGWNSRILPYLALPPGWRFLVAGGYEDLWFDPTLLSA